MKTYKQFHGEIEINQIGKELRTIIKTEHNNFKIFNAYIDAYMDAYMD